MGRLPIFHLLIKHDSWSQKLVAFQTKTQEEPQQIGAKIRSCQICEAAEENFHDHTSSLSMDSSIEQTGLSRLEHDGTFPVPCFPHFFPEFIYIYVYINFLTLAATK